RLEWPAVRPGTRGSGSSPLAALPPDKAGERPQPVSGGGEHAVGDAERRQGSREPAPLGRRRGGEALAQLAVRGVDAHLPARLRIDEAKLADARQLVLARIADLDGDDLVAAGEVEERAPPVEGASEVRDERDERPLPPERGDALDRVAEGRGARAPILGLVPQGKEEAKEPCPALPRRKRLRVLVPERHHPEPVTPSGSD